MAGYVLHLSTEENITLSSATVKRLIAGGSGDAALLYLAILHARGAADSGKLARELKWDETRLRAAEQALYEMKLVGAPEKKEEAPLPPPQQLSEPPEYTREDIARKLEGDGRFACLLREVEHKLGPLSTPSVKKLLGLYENLGLPADVVYTLVNYCIAKKEQQFGEGRLPNMREIEKEGYVWARKELFSIEKASEYMKREQALRGRYPEYMAALQMQGRASAPYFFFARLSMLAEKSVARSVRQRLAMAPVRRPVPQAHSSTASYGVMRELTAAMSALCVSLLKMSAKRS